MNYHLPSSAYYIVQQTSEFAGLFEFGGELGLEERPAAKH